MKKRTIVEYAKEIEKDLEPYHEQIMSIHRVVDLLEELREETKEIDISGSRHLEILRDQIIDKSNQWEDALCDESMHLDIELASAIDCIKHSMHMEIKKLLS